MGKSTILFVVFFTALLIYAKHRESPRALTSIQQRPKTPTQRQSQVKQGSKKVIRMKVTGYCPCKNCCSQYSDGKTSTGKDAWKTDGVAADPKILPYHTKLVIPGVGIREVDDTGGGMRQSAKKGIWHIDVRFPRHEEAKKFGVRWLNVAILSPVKN